MGSEIPSDWITDKLGNLGVFKSAGADKKESTSETPIGLVNYMDVYRNTKIDNSFEWMRVTAKPAEIQKCNLLKGDILFTPSSETPDDIGHSAVVVEDIKDAIFSYHLVRLRLHNQELLDLDFRRYFLNHYPIAKYFHSRATGITRYTLSRNDFRNCVVSFPKDINEQRTIASILSKVDEAIAATKNSIAKAERLKKSLMQNLLIGKLKPDGTWRKEDEFYKDEKFGNVPIGWEVKMVKELAINLDNKRKPIKAEDRHFMKGQYRYYGAAGIIDYIDKYIFEGKYILFGEDGENLLSRKLPQAFIVEGQFWVNNHAHILEPIYNVADIDFLCYQLEFKDYRNIVYGSAQPKINKSDLNKIKILTPNDTKEQKAIADKILTIEKTLENKQNKIQKLERLKKALMQNLLTGKVRVKIKETVNG